MKNTESIKKVLSIVKNYSSSILKLIAIIIVVALIFLCGVKYQTIYSEWNNKNVKSIQQTTIITGAANMYNNNKNIIILDSTNTVSIVIDSTAWDKIFQLGSRRVIK